MARDLLREVKGRTVTGVTVRKADVIKGISLARFKRDLKGSTIVNVWRRAKIVILDFEPLRHMLVHPRFTGALLIDRGDLAAKERQYSTLALQLDDGSALHYRDIRRLGTVKLMTGEEFERFESKLGLEPLERGFTAAALHAILSHSRQPVKKLIMDQTKVAGVGNIYAAEALWRSRIDPSREARTITAEEAERLHEAIVHVLRAAIRARGTSFRDYRDAKGERGGFVQKLSAYGRGGHACPRCGSRLIATQAIDGRTTVFCARCQR